MASSLGISTLLVSLMVVTFFSTPSLAKEHDKKEATDLKQICNTTKNRETCLKTLKSDPRTATANILGLADISIDSARSSAKEIIHMLSFLVKNTTDYRLRRRFVACFKHYEIIMNKLDNAKKLLIAHNYQLVADEAIDASEEAGECGGRFVGQPERPLKLKEKSTEFEFRVRLVPAAIALVPKK